MTNHKKFGFTLAEVIIVLAVLGIVAVLTLPGVVKKYQEAQARMKVKKSMAAYDTAINKMVIENDLKSESALKDWAESDDCENSIEYFKKVERNGCIFKTSDGVWWDVSDIMNPVISLNEEINEDNQDEIREKANDSNYKKAFALVANFDNNGSLRVNDLAFEKTNDENFYKQTKKLYNFLKTQTLVDGETSEYTFASQRQKFLNGDFAKSCEELCEEETDCENVARKSCTVYEDGTNLYVYDEKGYILVNFVDCQNYENCDLEQVEFNGHNIYYDCNEKLECNASEVKNDNIRYNCDGNAQNCTSSEVYEERDNLDITWSCDGTGSNCSGINSIKFKVNSDFLRLGNCNLDGSICAVPPGCAHTIELSCYDYADLITDEETGQKYWSIKEQYRPTRNSNLTYSE